MGTITGVIQNPCNIYAKMNNNKIAEIGAKIELAKRNFWDYCRLKAPQFYKKKRKYLKTLCEALQNFPKSDKKVLLVDLPPRHGKSRTLQLFVEWSLGHNHDLKIITCSYNETLSKTFAKSVRNSIQEIHADDLRPVYSDIFPDVSIKQGDGAMNLWSLQDGYNNYLATSPGGTVTGLGADYLLIDDIVKNAYEANNENIKDEHWQFFTNTLLSRLEEGGKIIIVMTRWATNDLAGRILEHYGNNVEHINMKAIQDDGSMLCDEILSRESCEEKKRAMGVDIFQANYQQEPIDIKGRLYSFKTYTEPLPEFKTIKSYTDTADTGADFLCSLVYGVTNENEAYILDAIYTDKAMEYTEPATAEMFYRNNVNTAIIESNNGGRGFARSVERILKQDYKTNKTTVKWFTQRLNKIGRILSAATWVMEHVYFPQGWHNKYPELYEALMKYQRQGKNAHDDAPDALTGIYDDLTKRQPMGFNAANLQRGLYV